MARYWAYFNEEVQGPFEVGELTSLEQFHGDLRVCVEGEQTWKPLRDIPEIVTYVKALAEFVHQIPPGAEVIATGDAVANTAESAVPPPPRSGESLMDFVARQLSEIDVKPSKSDD